MTLKLDTIAKFNVRLKWVALWNDIHSDRTNTVVYRKLFAIYKSWEKNTRPKAHSQMFNEGDRSVSKMKEQKRDKNFHERP